MMLGAGAPLRGKELARMWRGFKWQRGRGVRKRDRVSCRRNEGQAAIVGHFYVYTTEDDGKDASFKVGVLQAWQKENGNWKLYAR
jgi:ketosteroid isomerase-like protein